MSYTLHRSSRKRLKGGQQLIALKRKIKAPGWILVNENRQNLIFARSKKRMPTCIAKSGQGMARNLVLQLVPLQRALGGPSAKRSFSPPPLFQHLIFYVAPNVEKARALSLNRLRERLRGM